jgi:hypothetical protein
MVKCNLPFFHSMNLGVFALAFSFLVSVSVGSAALIPGPVAAHPPGYVPVDPYSPGYAYPGYPVTYPGSATGYRPGVDAAKCMKECSKFQEERLDACGCKTQQDCYATLCGMQTDKEYKQCLAFCKPRH